MTLLVSDGSFKMDIRQANYTTLLISGWPIFGTIAAQFGVTGVILTSVVPTLVAQRVLEPMDDEVNA